MESTNTSVETIQMAMWDSTFPDDAPTLRLHKIARMTAKNNFRVELLSIKRLQILYTVDGVGTLKYSGKTFLLKPGSSFFIDRQQEAELASASNEWNFIWLEITAVNLRQQ